MNKREAKRLAEEDTTPYGVMWRGKRDGGLGLMQVTGYRNAKIVQRGTGGVILTASEMERTHSGWRPNI